MLKEQVAKMMYDMPCKRYKCDFWDVQGNYCYANSADKNASYNCPMSTAILNLFKAEVDKLTVIENNPYWDAPHGSLEGVYEAGKKAQLQDIKDKLLEGLEEEI